VALAFLAVAVLLRCDRAGWIAAQERQGEDAAPPMALAQSSLPSRAAIPPAPQAEIDPVRHLVTQGQTAVFDSKSRAASNNPIIAHEWAGPAGLKSTGSRFTIDTAKLKPQTYSITLVVRDRLQRESEATAQLVILPAKQQSGTSADPRPVFRSPVARINPKTAQVTQGEPVRLSSRSSRPGSGGPILRRTWRTQWGQTSSGDFLDVDTRGLSAGNYWITLEVADQNQARHTDRATIVVLPVFAATPVPSYVPPGSGLVEPGPQPLARPPRAIIFPKKRSVKAAENAEFDGTRSNDPDGRIRSWSWRLDGKPLARGQRANIDTSRLRPGSHRVQLEVTDEQGLTAQDEALLIVQERPANFDAALVELEVSPAQTVANREVRIRAVVANRSRASLRNLPVRFEVDGAQIGQVILPSVPPGATQVVETKWLARAPGAQIVVATVNPDDRPAENNRTNNSRRFSLLVLAEGNVSIDPNPLEVNQGDTARFTAKLDFPGRLSASEIDYFWRGPENRIGQERVFALDTRQLAPGNHRIFLEISAAGGFKATAVATLIVHRIQVDLWLAADQQSLQAGGDVRFTSGSRPELSGVNYRFIFGDGAESEWSTAPEAVHRYAQPGVYKAQVLARRSGVDIGVASMDITVREIVYAVSLQAPGIGLRAGDSVTLAGRLEPTASNAEYLFQFGDGEESGWTRETAVGHIYRTAGAYSATVTARIAGWGSARSPPVKITVAGAAGWFWLWLGAGLVALAAATASYVRKIRRAPSKRGFTLVPQLNLETLRMETAGKRIAGAEIGLRSVRGESRFEIEGPIPVTGEVNA
jgi:PKD repeat protein